MEITNEIEFSQASEIEILARELFEKVETLEGNKALTRGLNSLAGEMFLARQKYQQRRLNELKKGHWPNVNKSTFKN